MNVCLMNDSFPPMIDGVSNAVINYAETISNGLGQAVVVTPKYPGAVDDYPFDVVRYRSMRITQHLCGYRAGYPFSSSKLDMLSDYDFDIIHSHCPFASMVMARVLREKTNVPIVFTYHTKFDIDIRRALKNDMLSAQAIKFVVDNIAACDEVWTVSRGAGDNLRCLGYEGEIAVMENGVDFPRGRADKDEVLELRSFYNVPDETVLFMFVGRLLWYKGIRLILDALKIVSDKGLDYRMMIVGDGMDRAEMEDYARELGIADKCIFTGAVTDREELRVYYTAGELFLFPSEYDTNGIVVREAAACGVGSLLISGSCAAEGITDGRTGILTDANPQAIAQKLEFALSHRDEIHQIGERAMNEVYLSWEDAVKRAYDRYPAVVERCMSGNSQRHEKVFTAELIKLMDNITEGVQQFRGIPAEIKSTGSTVRRKWHRVTAKAKSIGARKKRSAEIPEGFTEDDIKIESSVCTGEKTIGFYSKSENKLMYAELVRNDEDIDAFYKKYGISDRR
ncbi:MAG: glycosyltransferase family 4 protein [Ruminococcaceae bacterium]|nr:glycosyltransferase family 4 protein [Oscillospiraceae bacterium]